MTGSSWAGRHIIVSYAHYPSTGHKLPRRGGLALHADELEDPHGIPVPHQPTGGVASAAARACSIPPRGRFSRPIAARRLGRSMMSRLAGFYIAKATENAAAGTTAARASRIPPRRAGDHAALDPTRTHDGSRPTSHRAAATVHRFTGGLNRASRGRRRPGHLRLPPPEPAQQPSTP